MLSCGAVCAAGGLRQIDRRYLDEAPFGGLVVKQALAVTLTFGDG